MPFTSNWGNFTAAFECRFSPLDTAEAAHKVLKTIQQGKDSVAEYMSKFDQFTGQTGWSDLGHRQRFYDSLNDKVQGLSGHHRSTPYHLCGAMHGCTNH